MSKKADNMMEGWVPPFGDKAEAWKNISNRIDAMETASAKPVIPMWTKVASVAAMLALVTGLFFFSNQDTTVSTLAQEHQTVDLPDASTVRLNAASSVTFDNDWSGERVVTLDGEGFFEVEKGQRFTVRTANGDVTVLGTSFNVFSRGNKFEVSCTTGKVSVTKNDSEIILTPGLGTHSEQGSLKQAYARENAASWTNKIFVYDEEPLANVFAELERQYAIDIDHSAVAVAHEYSDEFDVNKQGLEEVLTNICTVYNLDYSISVENLEVIITQK